jgi:hypothetical protein
MPARDDDLPCCCDIDITAPGVAKLLKSLDPTKACGPDGISPRLLKECADELGPALTLLFQTSLNTGVVPADWRTAFITPVFKKGERYKAENYRPISLTSIPCKVMEHIVVSAVMGVAEEQTILCSEQHGFRKAHSCESLLIGFVDREAAEALERGNQEDLLIMDFFFFFFLLLRSIVDFSKADDSLEGKMAEDLLKNKKMLNKNTIFRSKSFFWCSRCKSVDR